MTANEPTDTRGVYTPPSAFEKSFNCPHCGALAKQFWHNAYAKKLKSDETPTLWDPKKMDDLNLAFIEDVAERERTSAKLRKLSTGVPSIGDESQLYNTPIIDNVFISQCYNCYDVAIWLYDRMLYPNSLTSPLPNEDLPSDIAADYREAASILDRSPRGTAAILRLAIQKLCKNLGGKGKNINDDIAALVKAGLDPRVQQALDVVRVVGNNAVHPGELDMSDDRATAEKLFGLVNLISEIMISQPKHVARMFDQLPTLAKAQIERRDV